MFTTISAREIQRGYKQVFQKANRTNKPIIVMSNNKTQGAVIGIDLLEKLQMDMVVRDAMAEYNAGKTILISTEEELENDLNELERYVEDKN